MHPLLAHLPSVFSVTQLSSVLSAWEEEMAAAESVDSQALLPGRAESTHPLAKGDRNLFDLFH